MALTLSNRLRLAPVGSTAWEAPDRQFCDAINAPAVVVRYILLRLAEGWFPGSYVIEGSLETIVFLPLVGLLWYAVTIELGGRGRSVLTHKTGAWPALDVLAIIFGLVLMVVASVVRYQFGHPATTYSNLVATPYLIWGLVLFLFYGRDLRAKSGHLGRPETDEKTS